MIGLGLPHQYPAPKSEEPLRYGVWPVDFLLETVLRAGLDWFRTETSAPRQVFGHLVSPWLNTKYGEAKIEEIASYMKKYEIKIVQHWSLISSGVPCISIQLLDASEMTERAGLSDFQQTVDALTAQGAIEQRENVGYSPIIDNIHIGIHNITTPDLTKYLYYFVIYILNAFKPQLETRGMHLSTFRATDVSRLNEYLPENIFSRFINFSVFSWASFDQGRVPIIEKILGPHVREGVAVHTQDPDDYLYGITITKDTKGGGE
jgi:hypothetical protein